MPDILRRVGQNTGTIFLVNLVGSVMGFLLAAALGRGLGDVGFGQYSLVMTWLLTLVLFTEFGLSTVLTRDLAAHPADTHRYLTHSLIVKSLLGLPMILLLLGLAPWIATNQNPAIILALRWGGLLFYTGLVYSSLTAVFKAHQTMSPILWLTLSGQIPLFCGTLALLLTEQPLFTIIGWAGLVQAFQCGLAFFFYQRITQNVETVTGSIDVKLLKLLMMRAWPFAVAGFLAAFQLRANVLLLAYLQGDQALGWYAAANRFIETGKQLPGSFYVAILPAMAALAEDARQQQTLQHTLKQARLGLLAFGLAAALGALMLAGPVLRLTYSELYLPATATLQLLSLSLIPNGQNSLFIIYLYARGAERQVNWLMAWGVVINLGLCWWLIPRWGAAGTALALLLTEVILYFFYERAVKQRVNQL